MIVLPMWLCLAASLAVPLLALWGVIVLLLRAEYGHQAPSAWTLLRLLVAPEAKLQAWISQLKEASDSQRNTATGNLLELTEATLKWRRDRRDARRASRRLR